MPAPSAVIESEAKVLPFVDVQVAEDGVQQSLAFGFLVQFKDMRGVVQENHCSRHSSVRLAAAASASAGNRTVH